MRKGIVAGSFDPITFGHIYVIREALKAVDEIEVYVATNLSKSYMFGDTTSRADLVKQALAEALSFEEFSKVKVYPIGDAKNLSVVEIARRRDAQVYFRGIRNTQDFEYERALQLVNLKFEPTVTTMFVMPPAHLTAVSSSMVKGLIGMKGWERIAEEYVPPVVIKALKPKEQNESDSTN